MSAQDKHAERQARLAARHATPRIGRTVVLCRGCATSRWYGIGPCGRCGEPGPAPRTDVQ